MMRGTAAWLRPHVDQPESGDEEHNVPVEKVIVLRAASMPVVNINILFEARGSCTGVALSMRLVTLTKRRFF
jgi:hypothetical protein